jgi:SpoVK/Ycf46/Vps4 family AAA+-type ATPase
LQECQTKKTLNYNQYLFLLGAMQIDYQDNKLIDTSFVGQYQSGNNQYYSMYSNSNWNSSSTQTEGINSYSIWQRDHEIDISLAQVSVRKEMEKTLRVNIDSNIQSLSDLIDIINKYEYREDTCYNIDIKSLHNIKSELMEMNAMIGMEKMKQSIVDQLLYFVQNLHQGNKVSEFKHTVIFGPPGTGKTELAKIIGQMYSKLGILKKNIFKKVTRNDLIAGYLGQTAIKTRKVIDECIGGVLFIDEAYSLANSEENDSFSKETIFKNETEFFSVIDNLSNDKELYLKCLENQYNIVNKYFNKDWLRNYIIKHII